jgi:hypothetical protein
MIGGSDHDDLSVIETERFDRWSSWRQIKRRNGSRPGFFIHPFPEGGGRTTARL